MGKAITAVTVSLVLITAMFSVAGVVSAEESTTSVDSGNSSVDRVVGYYTSWSRYERGHMPSDAPLDKVTHLNYAFLDVNSNGEVVLYDKWGDKENLETFRDLKKQHPDTKFLLSIGGWTLSDDFSDAALTQERRERFANTSVELMRKYNFDGIDVDWEYPGGGGKSGNTVRGNDGHNFTLLMQETRNALDRAESKDGEDYLLTMAASANTDTASSLEIGKLSNTVDFINVMTYDYHGAFDSKSNHNAPVYQKSNDPSPNADTFNVNHSITWWKNQPISSEKLSLGLPFYGRSFASVSDGGNGLYQDFSGSPDGTWGNNGVKDYWDVAANFNVSGNSYSYHWDDQAKVPWLYSDQKDVMISFDNPRSIAAKTDYAEQQGLGGLMFWETSDDKNDVLLDAALSNVDGVIGEDINGSPDDGDSDSVPTASISSSSNANVSESVGFDGSSSSDDVGIESYSWSFGDGSSGTGVTASHSYSTAGTYNVTLTVTDAAGQTDEATATVEVKSAENGTDNPPVASVTGPSSVNVSETANFDGSSSSDDSGIDSYSWNFGDGSSATGVNTTNSYSTSGTYNVTLTVTDTAGQTDRASTTVDVQSTDDGVDDNVTSHDRVFAPYINMVRSDRKTLSTYASNAGNNGFNLAFILKGPNGGPAWGGSAPVGQAGYETEIQKFQDNGEEVSIALGGAQGPYLASKDVPPEEIKNDLIEVVDTYGVDHIDVDEETFTTSTVERRNDALALLQQERPNVKVSYTLPTSTQGLTSTGLNVIDDAIDSGVDIHNVNIMTMNYGWVRPSAENAISSVEGLHDQLSQRYPGKTDAEIYGMIGVTPMIGVNNAGGSFYPRDAWNLTDYAQKKDLGMVSFWSIGRDNGNGSGEVSPTKSGIDQEDFEFSRIFNNYVGVTSDDPSGEPDDGNGTANEAPTASLTADNTTVTAGSSVRFSVSASDSDGTVSSSKVTTGDGGSIDATGQDSVSYTYATAGTYTAELTVTDDDGATATDTATVDVTSDSDDGSDNGTVEEWSSTETYVEGDRVSHDGFTWEAQWWTQGDEPGTQNWGPWDKVADDGGNTSNQAPSASVTADSSTVTEGDSVTFSVSSNDSDGTVSSASITTGDGKTLDATGQDSVTYTYSTAGTYTAEVTVTDDDGATATDSSTIQVMSNDTSNEVPNASISADSSTVTVGNQMSFTISSSDSDGFVSSASVETGDGTMIDAAGKNTVTHTYTNNGTYTATLTVMDDGGATSTGTATVEVISDSDDGSDNGSVEQWNSSRTYVQGDRVKHNGKTWEAQWWTQGDEPGTQEWGPWKEVGNSDDGSDGGTVEEWSSSETYVQGDKVSHDGFTWEAQWWTQGDEPGTQEWGPWEKAE
ncbi:MAG: glycosyl hydrolase family 18 protein [Halobacteria archaeon]